MAVINNTYKDLKAGFEIETSFIWLKNAALKNKTVLANIQRKTKDEKNNIIYKKFFKVVVEGNNGGYKTYPEFVSEALNTTEEIDEFFKVIRYIRSLVTKRPETLSQLLNLNNGIFKVEFAQTAYENLGIEIDLNGGCNPNSIHINLDVPFTKLDNLAKSSLFPVDGNIKTAPFKYACGIVKETAEFQRFSDNLKALLKLFFYQSAVYISEGIQKNFVELPEKYPFKDYVENTQGRADVDKLKFDVLFKVGKADIMRTILTPADNQQLVNEAVRTKIVDILKKIAILSSAKSTNPKGFPVKKYCECLFANAENIGRYYYDEPRISGLILPREIKNKKDYYVVAELRTTNLNNTAKNVFIMSGTDNQFKENFGNFIKKLCGFVNDLTK